MTFLPYLTGSTMLVYNPQARGVFSGIELKHGKAHFARSIMESVACVLRQFIDYTNVDVTEIRSIGGGAKSSLWCQIKADMTGKNVVTLRNTEIACLGTALFAFRGLGLVDNVDELTEKSVLKNEIFYPKENKKSSDIYKKFIELDKIFNKQFSSLH